MFGKPSEHHMYGSVTVNAKGQIVIPVEARERLWLKPGDQLIVTGKGDHMVWLIKASNLMDFVAMMQKDMSQLQEIAAPKKSPKKKKK